MRNQPVDEWEESEPDLPGSQDDESFVAALEEYGRRVAAGPVDISDFVGQYPAISERLRAYFEDMAFVDRFRDIDRAKGGAEGLVAGQMVRYFGDYELLEEIGRGGMGVVYRARQMSLNRCVAVKMILAGHLASTDDVERFRQEASKAAGLRHPNIVTIFECGQHQGQHFYSMEFIQGRDLRQLVRERPLAAGQAAEHARTMARAVAAMHASRLLHRDLKPSNVLVESATGGLRIADLGLAKSSDPQAALTASGQALGTPSYMAPEQAAGQSHRVGPATDVYGIGATLYEMLTGRPPFVGETPWETIQRVCQTEVVPLRTLNPQVPRDLETICLKCLAKEIGRRYSSATELEQDLDRFLAGVPIRARPAGRFERAWRWCRRNRGWAAFYAAASLTMVLAVGSAFVVQAIQTKAARERARTAEAEAHEQTRNGKLQELQRVQLMNHVAGWSRNAGHLLRDAARMRWEPALRDYGIPVLHGLDATLEREHLGFGARLPVFDPSSQRLLVSGWESHPARLIDGSGTPTPAKQVGDGPVAFVPTGEPVQLIAEGAGHLALAHVLEGSTLRRLTLPDGARLPDQSPYEGLAVACMTRDAARIACLVKLGEQGQVAIWNGATGELLHVWPLEATALTFSDDGRWLAGGTDQGEVKVRELNRREDALTCVASRFAIRSLAIALVPSGGDVRQDEIPGDARLPVLAIGTSGGELGIWSLATGKLLVPCYGCQFDVHALHFSPDGALLASGDRDRVRIWDVRTGQTLLRLTHRNWIPGVAFSPDGRRLAATHLPRFNYPGGVDVWRVESGRGISALRGLAAPVALVRWSRDGRRLLALSHDWQLAVWERESGQLRHLLNMPAGLYADNGAIAIDEQGDKLAFSAGKRAILWDLTAGRAEREWSLPESLADQLEFLPDGGLRSFRCETRDGRTPPYGEYPAAEFPRVIRIRDLLAADKLPLEIPDFNWYVSRIAVGQQGALCTVEGLHGRDGKQRSIVVFDAGTGAVRKTLPVKYHTNESLLNCDSTGSLLLTTRDATWHQEIVRLDDYSVLSKATYVRALGPGAARWLGGAELRLYQAGAAEPIVALADTPDNVTCRPAFDVTGRFVAWGNSDGTVSLVDVESVQGQLAGLGLGW